MKSGEALPEADDPSRDRRRDALVVSAVMALAVLVRFPTLGSDSLWMDEILLWGVVRENGLAWPRGSSHPLTEWTQALALRLGDNAFCLRLPSAIFGTALVLVATLWALRRFGRVAALVTGALFALWPFGTYYSQDANHYPPLMLAGLLAMTGVDWLLASRERPAWGRFALAGVVAFAAVGFHPLGALPAGVFALMLAAWSFAHPGCLPLGRLGNDARRLGIVIVGGAAALAAALWGWRLLDALEGTAAREPTAFAWTWRFWSGTLADFHAATYHRAAVDVVLGTTGLLAAAAGLALMARRNGACWAAAGGVLTAAAALFPFTFFEFSQYFSPRYIGAMGPVLLLGTSIAFAHAFAQARRSMRWRLAAAAAAVWLALFAVRAGQWHAHRLRTEHQATRPAMEWLRGNTPEDARVFTSLYYSSRATRFLWRAGDMGGREHHPVSWVRHLAAPSLHQMDAALARGGRPCWFLSLSDYERTDTPGLGEWLEQRGELAASFPSGTPAEPWPIDRNIRIWRLHAPEFNPLHLPRFGNEASALLGETRMRRMRDPWLALAQRTGAAWDFETTETLKGLTVLSAIVPPVPGARERWLFGALDGADPWVWALPALPQETVVRFVLPVEIAPGAHRFEAAAVLAPGPVSVPTAYMLLPGKIDAWDGAMQDYDRRGTRLVPASSQGGEGTHHIDIPAGQLGVVNTERLALAPPPAAAPRPRWLFVEQRAHVGGLGDRNLWTRARLGGWTLSLLAAEEWTHGWTRGAAALPAEGTEPAVEVFSELLPAYGRRPYDPFVEIEPARAWWLIESEAD